MSKKRIINYGSKISNRSIEINLIDDVDELMFVKIVDESIGKYVKDKLANRKIEIYRNGDIYFETTEEDWIDKWKYLWMNPSYPPCPYCKSQLTFDDSDYENSTDIKCFICGKRGMENDWRLIEKLSSEHNHEEKAVDAEIINHESKGKY